MHKVRQLFKALKWQKQVRAAVSTQLTLLENPSVFALGGLTAEEESRVVELVHAAAETAGPIIEFGTLFGLTTLLFAAEKAKGREVITVDNFCWNPFGLPPALHEVFTRRILRNELSGGNVSLYRGDSATFRATYQGATPAMVFLDADHSYEAVREEITWAEKQGVPLICGHDYGNRLFGVTQAVDEAFPRGVQVRGMVWSNKAL
jgi:hypothetical protein